MKNASLSRLSKLVLEHTAPEESVEVAPAEIMGPEKPKLRALEDEKFPAVERLELRFRDEARKRGVKIYGRHRASQVLREVIDQLELDVEEEAVQTLPQDE